MTSSLSDIVFGGDEHVSMYSCCSANGDVLRAAIMRAKQTGSTLLVEATSNQVNQYGGYTGYTPAQFKEYVLGIADELNFPREQLFLGGDHLGPLVWCSMPEAEAMAEAEAIVRAYVASGYEKIHLDTSMRVGSDDPSVPFPVAVCARRGAELCAACEDEFAKYKETHPGANAPIYVIGSEVPVPGGEVGNDPSSSVTTSADYDATIEAYRREFEEHGLQDAFGRISALVVEMGVEFSEYRISEYDHEAFAPLAQHAADNLIRFEAHSTDYQTSGRLRQMAEDGAVFLKVGPALTFAARSALFRLEMIERELVPSQNWSHYRERLDAAMLANPAKWDNYYHGTDDERAFARAFSFSDRCRYYFDVPDVRAAHDTLLANLNDVELPECLLIELFYTQYRKVRAGKLAPHANDLLYDVIGEVIDDYLFATGILESL